MMHLYSYLDRKDHILRSVLILVVMDDALVLVSLDSKNITQNVVLILVVMDDALVPSDAPPLRKPKGCLNPCCNG